LYERLGKPRTEDFPLTLEGHPAGPQAPQSILEVADLARIDPQYLTDTILIIDYGEALFADQSPRDAEELGIPGHYRAPELYFNTVSGFGIDLWALGCNIFEIRAGISLQNWFGNVVPLNTAMLAFVKMIGLPKGRF
jgi:serine/threonine protein kinase